VTGVGTTREGEPSLLVVIVNYRLADHTERLLQRRPFGSARVALVDNGSEPERLESVAASHGAELLLLDRNYGFAGAVNEAVRRCADHDQILLLNPDVELTPDALAALRTALVSGRLTGVSPLLHGTDGRVQVGTAGGPVTLSGFATYFLFLAHLIPTRRGIFYTRRQLRSGLTPAWLCMACLLLDGDAFRRFGAVPEYELAYAEDVAWGIAASAAGARFAVLPEVGVVHEQGAAGASSMWRAALARLAVRENGRWAGWLAVACMRVGLAVRAVARPAVKMVAR
jgi:GT2 family glycosyltransferase